MHPVCVARCTVANGGAVKAPLTALVHTPAVPMLHLEQTGCKCCQLFDRLVGSLPRSLVNMLQGSAVVRAGNEGYI